ncbi:hypothetical protein ABID16_004634 [Rhizobium aquaticum]|uniref:Integrase n=1 Tax=Rhizobium aquaticum TaxID=1549636 RepID=A0ABV2J698_9HYPH
MLIVSQIMQQPPANTSKIVDIAPGDLPDDVDVVTEMGVSPPAPQPTPRVSARLEALVETATAYANAASSENTREAYAKDWRHFTAWCRREGFEPLPPSSQVIGSISAPVPRAPLPAVPNAVPLRSRSQQ